MNKELIEKKLEELEIESIEEFQPDFYTMNLVDGYEIKKKAIKNLFDRFENCKEQLLFIENYDEIGIVEYVANDKYDVVDNRIVPED